MQECPAPSAPCGQTIRVAHVDDDSFVRSAVRCLVEAEPGMRITGSYPDAEHALLALETDHADVLVMDMSMPGMGGLMAIPRVREVAPQVSIVMLSSADFDPHGQLALAAGAHAYLQKPVSRLELMDAIRAATRRSG